MSELVSILIPAYNAERWIGGTIESALAQSWKRKEVIVVDDGSTDHTLKVAKRFEAKGIVVLTQGNKGAAAARNTALRAAQGSYMQFLDADDLLHPDKLTHQIRQAEDGGSSRTLLTGSWGRFFVRHDHASLTPDSLWQDLSPVDWLVTKFTQNKFMFPASWLVSRHLVEAAGPWDESLSMDDDGEYMCRLVATSCCVKFVPRARCYYRIGNPSSLSSQTSASAMRSEFHSIRLCIDHLLSLEDSAKTRHACVRLLQDNLPQFYPEHSDLVAQSHSLAHSLCGALHTPRERAHFKLFRSVLGWQRAKQLRGRLNATKLSLRRTLDRLPRLDRRAGSN